MRASSIVILVLLLWTSCLFSQNVEWEQKQQLPMHRSQFYLRIQPLYLFTHATIAFEGEYFLVPKHSISLEYFYTGYVTSDDGFSPCFSCWATDFSDRRQLIDVQYKFYMHENPNEGVVYISPYARLRIWEGPLDQFVPDYTSPAAVPTITSAGLALGGTVGVRWASPRLLDFTMYIGMGGYLAESYQVPEGYALNNYLKADLRMGWHLGIKLF